MKAIRWIVLLSFTLYLLPGCQSQTKESLLQEGLSLGKAGNHAGALVCYKNALEKDANFFQARFELGRAYMAMGKYGQAEKEFQKVLHQSPDFPGAALALAESYLESGRHQQALDTLQRMIAGKGEEVQVLVLKGRALAGLGDPAAAEDSLEQALRIVPGHPDAQVALASLYIDQDRGGEAQNLLETLLRKVPENKSGRYLLIRLELNAGLWERAIEQCSRLAEIDPSDPRPLYLAGLLHLQSGDAKKGQEFARQFAERFPDNPLLFQLRGLGFYREKKYDLAAVELQKVLRTRLDPVSGYFLGLCHYHLGKLELALSQMQKVLDLKPESVPTRIMVAMILLQQRRVDDAVREIQIVLRRDEGNGLAHNILGSAYLAQEKIDEAMAEFNRALELDPTLVDAHLKKGMFNLFRGRTTEGESEIIRALSIAPEVLDSRIVLASHYLQRQNHAAALKLLREGLKGKPADAVLYNLIASVHFSQQQPRQAVEALQSAKIANPDFFTPFFNLATYYASRGEYDLAVAEYTHVLFKNPKHVRALVAMGQVLEVKGEDEKAASFYEKARATHDLGGVLAAAGYQQRKGHGDQALTILEEAIAIERQTALLELRGRLLMQQGQTGEAVKAFEDLESASPGRGYPALVQIWLREGAVAKAEALARQVLQAQPGKPYGYLLLASIYEARNDLEGAMKVLQEARRRVVQTKEIDLRIGSIQEREGKLEEATDLYRQVVERSPDYHPALFSLAAAYHRSGKEGEARLRYEQILRLAQNFAPAQNNLAYLYADDPARKEEALRLALQAFRQSPERPEIMDTLGYVLLRNGRPAQAVQILEKAAAAMPGQPTIHFHLGQAYRELGDTRKAVDALRKSLENGDFPERSQVRSLLTQLAG